MSIFLTALFICAQLFSIHAVLKSFDGETMEHRVLDEVVMDPFLVPHVRTVDVTQSNDFGRVVATAFVAALLAILAVRLAEPSGGVRPLALVDFGCGARGRIWLFRRRILI
jgi:hypothetical protein